MRARRVLRLGLLALLVWACVFLAARDGSPEKPATPILTDQGRLAGRVIAVDAGHGGYDGGARARDSGVWEKQINLAVALKLEALLKAEGARVVMTRATDASLDQGGSEAQTRKRQDMEARVALMQDAGAHCVISVHMNEYRSRAQSGPQVFYRKEHEPSMRFAQVMQSALIEALEPVRERVASPGNYFILSLDTPSVLVECGFISNAAEEKLLLSDPYQSRVAEAIVSGVCAFLAQEAP